MLQQDQPDDYVIATGVCHSVEEFLDIAFSYVGLNYKNYLEIDEKLFRPAEKQLLQGDTTKARNKLNWQYNISLQQLIHEMVDHDLALLSK